MDERWERDLEHDFFELDDEEGPHTAEVIRWDEENQAWVEENSRPTYPVGR